MGRQPGLLNVPNVLSAYRLAASPAILYAIVAGHRILFAALILINLVTDILDGFLARVLRQQTALGARLDSLGDLVTYFLAILGMAVLEQPFLRAHRVAFGLLVGFYLAAQMVCLFRFRRPISLHLYSSKLTAYVQGAFFGVYFLFAYVPAAFYCMLAVSLLNNVEELIVLSVLPENRSDVRGLYWVLKDRDERG